MTFCTNIYRVRQIILVDFAMPVATTGTCQRVVSDPLNYFLHFESLAGSAF